MLLEGTAIECIAKCIIDMINCVVIWKKVSLTTTDEVGERFDSVQDLERDESGFTGDLEEGEMAPSVKDEVVDSNKVFLVALYLAPGEK